MGFSSSLSLFEPHLHDLSDLYKSKLTVKCLGRVIPKRDGKRDPRAAIPAILAEPAEERREHLLAEALTPIAILHINYIYHMK